VRGRFRDPTSFIGTVVAPNTSVELYDNQTPYYGRFYGKHVTVHPDVLVVRQLCHSINAVQ
jgi:hypothetical protein